jgi:release factor glutamine methyltransferase
MSTRFVVVLADMLREGLVALNGFLRIDAALDDATKMLQAVSDSPRLDAELLLSRALDVSRSYLFAHPDDEMDADAARRFQTSLTQRARGMPMAYIAGFREFWSMELIVSPATLIPRPETETIIDQALMRLPRREELSVLDLGTGSGAISLAIARERPLCRIVATDISADAIAVARENARRLGMPNIEFLAGDWLEPVAGRMFDLVVSNPPYVASGDPHLEALRFEPRSALEAGADGLDAIRTLAAKAMPALKPGGAILLEHGADQAEGVAALLAEHGWIDITLARDLAGLPRVTAATSRS